MKRMTLVAACAGLLLLSACASKPDTLANSAQNAVAPTNNVNGKAYFAFNKSDLNDTAKSDLKTVAKTIKAQGGDYTVEGYTDNRGTDAYNLALGQRRAEAAKAFLVSQGVSANDLETISYGKADQVCSENTESCWQNNRRVLVVPK
jgi:peptidoglycan-associated lipoprotein